MDRLKCALIVAVLAVAVCAVAASPALAAKGGNSDNAHACQQGGHESRFEAETGRPFNNAGDCASHGALGGAISSLQILTTPTYSCPSTDQDMTCWGTFVGSGLLAGSEWRVSAFGVALGTTKGSVGASGSVSAQLNIPCSSGFDPFPTFVIEATASTEQPLSRLVELIAPVC